MLLAACAAGPERREVRHQNGALAQAGTVVEGKQQGEWAQWYASGVLQARGTYADDERTGTWTHWYENGRMRMTGAYRDDRQSGLWQFWHDNGALQCRGEFRQGREHGEWTFGHPSGQLQQRGCFQDGHRVLFWEEFYAHGAPRSAGNYLDDQPVGVWRRWDENGAVSEVTYPMPAGWSLVVETWDDGGVRRTGFLRDGAPAGLWLTRHRGGALRAIACFDGGVPREFAAFGADGSELARGPLDAGRPAGSWQIRDAGGERALDVVAEPRAPWDRQWSDASFAEQGAPMQVAVRWLDELTSPAEAAPLAAVTRGAPAPEPVPAVAVAPPQPRIEAPTDPGAWTVSEREELQLLRRYYRDGWLPRSGAGGSYAQAAQRGRLGSGDASIAEAIVGKELPVARFLTGDGGTLDLRSLRGKRVLLVVLRGFTTQVCVYCFAQTAELVAVAPKLRALACEVVVMFPGSRSRLDAFVAACADEFGGQPPPYHMVYDPDLDLARALGLQGNLARPSSFVLDRDGIVRHAYVAESETNIADRPSAQALVDLVGKIQ
jgi:antitoxin component YwqK of YwqJK toxin-antitoxin module/peroxiredoxin